MMAWHERVQTEKQLIRLGNASLYYEVAGAGKPLVLVHGLAASRRWWAKNLAVLTQHFRVYLVDLIGFGKSRRQQFVLDEAARTLVQWMDALGLAKVDIIGHSMGGRIAAELAADYPERVERLILVAAPILPFGYGLPKGAWGVARALRRLPLDFLRVLVGDTLQAGSLNVLRIGRQILLTDRSTKLSAIQAPTLIIWGEHDTIVPLPLGEALAQGLPQSRMQLIKGVGHVPMWEKPETFNRLVLEFLHCSPANETNCGETG
jgi:pimeloyl-ACP methyl ester carboxylesterase